MNEKELRRKEEELLRLAEQLIDKSWEHTLALRRLDSFYDGHHKGPEMWLGDARARRRERKAPKEPSKFITKHHGGSELKWDILCNGITVGTLFTEPGGEELPWQATCAYDGEPVRLSEHEAYYKDAAMAAILRAYQKRRVAAEFTVRRKRG